MTLTPMPKASEITESSQSHARGLGSSLFARRYWGNQGLCPKIRALRRKIFGNKTLTQPSMPADIITGIFQIFLKNYNSNEFI